MNWLSGSGGFLMQCEMALLIYSRLHHQDVDVECWWCGVAEHFVGFRLIDSPWKIYQHPRLWNILLDKWKWMMQVPCCNIWISEKKVFWKLFGPLDMDPWFLSNMKNFVLLLGRLYVGSGETRGGGWGRTCVSQCINNKLKYNTKTKHITILQILHNTAQLHILTIFYVGIGNIFVPWSIRRDGNVWRE